MPPIEPEPTIKSETVFSGRLVTLKQETVRLPSGSTTEREIVVHPNVVAVLPVLPDGRLVMVRQYRKAVERVLLEIPAGGIESGESPEQAARREMQEETGYTMGELTPLAAFYTSPGFTTEFMYLFKAHDLTPGTPTEVTDQLEIELLSPEAAHQAIGDGQIADAKTLLALCYLHGGR